MGYGFRVLRLYHDLMNLYGDWANALALARELIARGHEVAVDKRSVGGDADFNCYDIVFIGSGTEWSQHACMLDLARYKDALIEQIEAGMPVIATGNAHELFGHAVTSADGMRFGALGLLDFEAVQENTRVTGDCVCRAAFLSEKLIGFINRSGRGQEGSIERPFIMELGPGANDQTSSEGIHYKNLLGTYMTGPILVRNPPLLRYVADIMVDRKKAKQASTKQADEQASTKQAEGSSPRSDQFFAHQEAAYRMALTELSARIGKK